MDTGSPFHPDVVSQSANATPHSTLFVRRQVEPVEVSFVCVQPILVVMAVFRRTTQ